MPSKSPPAYGFEEHWFTKLIERCAIEGARQLAKGFVFGAALGLAFVAVTKISCFN
jgi:hypothetical protein